MKTYAPNIEHVLMVPEKLFGRNNLVFSEYVDGRILEAKKNYNGNNNIGNYVVLIEKKKLSEWNRVPHPDQYLSDVGFTTTVCATLAAIADCRSSFKLVGNPWTAAMWDAMEQKGKKLWGQYYKAGRELDGYLAIHAGRIVWISEYDVKVLRKVQNLEKRKQS